MKKGFRIFILIIGLLISLAVPLITSSLGLLFDPHSIESSAFWIRWIVVQIGVMSAYGLLTNFTHSQNIDRPEYVEKEGTIKKLVSTVDIDLADYLIEYNRHNKAEAYKALMKSKLLKQKEKLVRLKTVKQISKTYQKAIEKTENKIKILEQRTTPEYIDKNIDFVRVKYPHITKSQLFNDEVMRSTDDIISSAGEFYTNKTFGRFFRSALLTAVFASITVVGFVSFGPGLIYNLITTFFNICLAAYSGYKTANIAYQNILLVNQLNRTTILKSYYDWRKTRPSQPQAEVTTNEI